MSPQWYNDDINGLFKIALLLQRNLRPHVKFQVLSSTQSQRVLGLESHQPQRLGSHLNTRISGTTEMSRLSGLERPMVWAPLYRYASQFNQCCLNRKSIRQTRRCVINLLDFFQVVFLPFALLLGHLFVLISTTKKV